MPRAIQKRRDGRPGEEGKWIQGQEPGSTTPSKGKISLDRVNLLAHLGQRSCAGTFARPAVHEAGIDSNHPHGGQFQ
jgi:hypothetical protein